MLRFILMILLGVLSRSCWSQEEGSSDRVKEISDQAALSYKLCFEGNREEALAMLQDLEKLSEQELGGETIQYARALSIIAGTYSDMGELDRARHLFGQSSRFIAQGPHQMDSLHALNLREIARIYFYQRNYDSARVIIGNALSLQERKFGKSSAAHALSQLILANIEADLGDYKKAIFLAEEAKGILGTKWGAEHRDYANCLTVLAKAKSYSGEYADAEHLLTEALQIQEKLHQENHLDHARSLVTLANVYVDNGNYDRADSLFSRALSIEEHILGKQNLEYASVLSDYALLLRLTGQFDKAEPALLHDKLVCELKLGKRHLDYSTACNNLALFYDDVGNYEKAEALLIEAMEITERVLGEESPDYSTLLNNLGYLYRKMGMFSKAAELHLEEISLCNRILGKNHPDCVSSLFHLSEAYYQQGNYRSADSLFPEAIAKWKRISGKWNPEYARGLYSYGQLQQVMGKWNRADSLLGEAKGIQEKILGKEHPDYLATCISLAELYERQNKWGESELLQVEIKKLQLANMTKSVSYFSENEMTKFVRTFEQTNDLLYSYMAHRLFHGRPFGLLPELAFDQLLFYKGFLLFSASKLNVLAGMTMESNELNRKRKMYFRLLAKEYVKPSKERDLKAIDDLQEKSNAVEKELIRKVSGFSRFISQVHWREVGTKLKPDEAVIEFVSFQKRFPFVSDSILYAAEILRSGDRAPEFIFLCEQKSVDSILHSGSDRKSDYVNGLYSLLDRGAVAVESPKRTLYELFWKPLESRLNGVSRIYFSPSGLLHKINLGAIPVSETEAVSDRYTLIQLNSTRQLVISDHVHVENSEAVLYGGIYFERDTTIKYEEPVAALWIRDETSLPRPEAINRGESWSYLPGTEHEVNSIERNMQAVGFQVNIYKAYEASEDSFKTLGAKGHASPRIIHLATHGYFFANSKDNGQQSIVNGQFENVFKASDHPMLRSGLILSGGNAAWQGRQTMEGKEDGILTAYEISQMNLSNTELVVLSACETGLGDIQGNEGVYGLQRAFKIAGVKYLIMSLWQVPDKQTSMLMTTFYRKWLESGEPGNVEPQLRIPETFHAAQKELRELGFDPYQWAGFVLVE